MKKKQIKRRLYIMLSVLIGIIAGMSISVYAAGNAFEAGADAINDFQVFFIAISTAALAVALGIAHLMKTFSGGNPQKIEFANKLTVGAIIGWTLVNGVGLIANTIAGYLK